MSKQPTPKLAAMPGAFTLTSAKGEARVDSRLIATALGNQHKNVMELIGRYTDMLSGFGKVAFKTEPLASGQHERYALLNEDQAFFLLTLSRNTARVVQLKARLVQAFSEARRLAQQHGTEYLPTYHELHDAIGLTVAQSANQRHIHANFNKLVNKATGIDSGQRPSLTQPQQSMLTVAQHIAATAVRNAPDHKTGYAAAKSALQTLTTLTVEGKSA